MLCHRTLHWKHAKQSMRIWSHCTDTLQAPAWVQQFTPLNSIVDYRFSVHSLTCIFFTFSLFVAYWIVIEDAIEQPWLNFFAHIMQREPIPTTIILHIKIVHSSVQSLILVTKQFYRRRYGTGKHFEAHISPKVNRTQHTHDSILFDVVLIA